MTTRETRVEKVIDFIVNNFGKYDKVDEFYLYYGKWRLWRGTEIKLETGEFFFGTQVIITGKDQKKLRKLIDNLEK